MIIFGVIAVYFVGAIASWAALNIKAARHTFNREQAIQIAEAGIDYYRWHLAHAPADFQDGTSGPGPYVHTFRDKDGTSIGTFELTITAPMVGSTLVTIASKGSVNAAPGVSRTITSQLGKPSFAKYAVVANDFMRFGTGTEVFGPVHSNAGIRFDSLAHNIVTSAVASSTDPDHTGGKEFGVHTHGNLLDAGSDPLPPAAVPSRPLIFEAGRQFPVPVVNFGGIAGSLTQMKTDAQASGVYLAPSGALGYRILLKTNDTFDVYSVNTLVVPPEGCSSTTSGWGTWSVNTQTFLRNYPIPTNGLVFVEDHVWVEGQINTARVTIASGKFPDNSSTRTSITVNNDLLYTNYDGQDVIALIAQNNFNVGLVSEDDLRIDAALMAQNGRVGRYYYSSSCAISGTQYWKRLTLTLYGMIGTYQRYGFAYIGTTFTCPDGTQRASGYCARNINYDASLLYGPPPSFPLTSEEYITLTWEEE